MRRRLQIKIVIISDAYIMHLVFRYISHDRYTTIKYHNVDLVQKIIIMIKKYRRTRFATGLFHKHPDVSWEVEQAIKYLKTFYFIYCFFLNKLIDGVT